MADRTGNGVVRHCFRTRDGEGEHKLPVGQCGKCGGETYQVLAGSWLHWSTLTEECPKPAATDGLESLSDGQEG